MKPRYGCGGDRATRETDTRVRISVRMPRRHTHRSCVDVNVRACTCVEWCAECPQRAARCRKQVAERGAAGAPASRVLPARLGAEARRAVRGDVNYDPSGVLKSRLYRLSIKSILIV